MDDHPCPDVPGERVGFGGLGAIGLPMAERLFHCGLPLVAYNRTPDRAEGLRDAGARVVDTPAALAAAADVVVTCLHGPPADRDVYLGPDGLLSIDVEGKLFVDTATVGPEWARELAGEVRARGAGFVDAPIMGAGAPSARAGRLVFPIGGSEHDCARALPILRVMAVTVERVGDAGAAQVVKLANNMQIAVHAAALSEALHLAVRAGADAGALARLLPQGSSRSRAMELWLDAMVTRDHGTGGSLRTLAKDITLATELAESLGQVTSVAAAAQRVFERACADELGDRGVSALVEIDDA